MKAYRKFFITIIFLGGIIFPQLSFAGEVVLGANKNNFLKGESFLLTVNVDQSGESLNAIEGTLVFPTETLELQEIRDGNTAVNFWLKRPVAVGGSVEFSGITPGGFSQSKNLLFTLVFIAKRAGSGNVLVQNVQLLKNDGSGGTALATTKPFSFSISSQGSTKQSVSALEDAEIPENFTPQIARDENLYNGQYFVVFSTQDKISGIDHYEIKEGSWGKFLTATSPYVLHDQTLTKKIYIKAIDFKGNERLVVLPATHNLLYQPMSILVIILVLLGLIIVFKKWQKKSLHR